MKDDKYNKSSIIYLNRSQLEPHPDNPRKDLGDLEELRESIREHGIMQNLTVIPTDDTLEHFRILIGHRRFAASEGILTELPCVMVEGLSDREQVGIMLCENIQRSDLTYIEQARGFQMMLDLGDTVETIAEKTGFSEKTIKSRLEINKLDEDTLEEASERFQLSIKDFMELSKIKDVEKRNEILETSDNSEELADSVEQYIEEMALESNFSKYLDVLNEVGWEESSTWFGNGYERLPEFGYSSVDLKEFKKETVEKIRKAAETHKDDKVYYRKSYRSIEFAKKIKKVKEKDRKKTREELRQEAIHKQTAELEHARAEICDEYLRFILDLTQAECHSLEMSAYKNKLKNCIEILEKNSASISDFSHFYGGNIRTLIKEDLQIGPVYKQSDPLKKLFFEVWYELAQSYKNKFVGYDFIKSGASLRSHQSFYSTLYSLGFRLPENLRAVIEGNSDLYIINGTKKDKE